MAIKFRKRIKIAPGVKLNVSSKGLSSVSIGGKGMTLNAGGKKGAKLTTTLKNIAIESVIVVLIFTVSVIYFGINTFAGWFGVLAYSIAFGSIVFFTVFSPHGTRSKTTVFGYVQSYRHPVSFIPTKSAVFRIVAIVACCAIAFGFYAYAE